MSFFELNITQSIQKGWARYIIHRYLGQYLQQNLSLDQMDLTSSSVKLSTLNLNVEYVNEKLRGMNIPLTLVDGYIGEIVLDIPWTSLSSQSSKLKVSDLELTFQASEDFAKDELLSSMFEGMADSMVTPEDIAKDYYESSDTDVDVNGINNFKKVIDTIVSRFCMDVENITIRLEVQSKAGLYLTTAIELRIAKAQFMDEQLKNMEKDTDTTHITNDLVNAVKCVQFTDIEVFTDFFYELEGEHEEKNLKREKQKQSSILTDSNFTSCYASVSEMPKNMEKNEAISISSQPVKILRIPRTTEVFLRFQSSSSQIKVNINCTTVQMFCVPSQIEIIKSVFHSWMFSKNKQNYSDTSQRRIEDNEYEKVVGTLEQLDTDMSQARGLWREKEVFQPFTEIHLETSDSFTENNYSERENISDSHKVDSSSDTSVQIDIGSLVCCFPLEDPLHALNPATADNSIKILMEIAEEFFQQINEIHKDEKTPLQFEHIKCITALRFFYDTKRNEKFSQEKIKVVMNDVATTEYIKKDGIISPIDIIRFTRSEGNSRPDIEIRYSSVMKGEQLCEITLNDLRTNLDITILNRLKDFVYPTTVFNAANKVNVYRSRSFNNMSAFPLRLEEETVHSNLRVLISCENMIMDLKVPKADLSSKKVTNSMIHDEYLKLDINGLQIDIGSNENEIEISTTFNSFKGDFIYKIESGKIKQSRLFHCLRDENPIRLNFTNTVQLLNGSGFWNDVNDLSHSLSRTLLTNHEKREGPFSPIRKVFTHSERNSSENRLAQQDIVQAGNIDDLNKFRRDTTSNSVYNIQLKIPQLRVCVESSYELELLYNRFTSDLVLWEPDFAARRTSSEVHVNAFPEEFQAFTDKSNLENVGEFDRDKEKSSIKPHKLSFDLDIHKVDLLLLNEENEEAIESSIKHLAFRGSNVSFFAVIGYNGDFNTSYFYLTTKRFFLSDLNSSNKEALDLMSSSFGIKNEKTCAIRTHDDPTVNDNSISFAAKVLFEPEINLKDMLFALNIKNVLVTISPDVLDVWLVQFVQYLSLKTYDVPGYEFPQSTTDLHLSFENVSIAYDHYRFFPESIYGLSLNFGFLYMSATFSEGLTFVKYNFIVEDTSLTLNKLSLEVENGDRRKDEQPFDNMTRIKACELDLFHIEIYYCLLNMDEVEKSRSTLLDVSCTNDVITASMCADTLVALLSIADDVSSDLHLLSTPTDNNLATGNIIEKKTYSVPAGKNESEQSLLNTHNVSDRITKAIVEQPSNSRKAEKEFDFSTMCDIYPHQALDPYADREAYAVKTDDEFCVIDEGVIGSGVLIENTGYTIRQLDTSRKITVDPCFLKKPMAKNEASCGIKDSEENPFIRFCLNNISVQFNFYGGCDLKKTDQKLPYSGLHKEKCDSSEEIKNRSLRGLSRDETVAIKIDLKKITFSCNIYHESSKIATTKFFAINDIVITDKLAISHIKEILYQYSKINCPKRTCAPFLAVRILETSEKEGKIRVSMLPLKLNIDQDTMLFVEDFIQEVIHNSYSFFNKDSTIGSTYIPEFAEKANLLLNSSVLLPGESNDMVEGMSLQPTTIPEAHQELLVNLTTDMSTTSSEPENPVEYLPPNSSTGQSETNILNSNADVYYRDFTFFPSVSVFIDYHGKNKMNLDRGGAMIGILRGFAQLNGTEIILKELSCKNGLLGVSRCIDYALNEWSNDLVTSLPTVLASYGPISPIVQIGRGFMDLFWMPIAEFKKPDGHIVKGIQKGVGSFSMSSAAGIVGIAQSLVGAVQLVGEAVLNEVQLDEPYLNKRNRNRVSITSSSPTDFPQGLQMAYKLMAEGVRQTKEDYHLTAQEDRASGLTSIKTLVRFAPPAILRPLVIGFQISFHLLGGIRNQLRPDIYKDECLKWENTDLPTDQND